MLGVRVAITKDGTEAERAAHIEDHKAHLRSANFKIVLSGPAFAPGGAQIGALVVAEVEDISELESFSATDPFVRHGVYGDISIYEWRASIDNR